MRDDEVPAYLGAQYGRHAVMPGVGSCLRKHLPQPAKTVAVHPPSVFRVLEPPEECHVVIASMNSGLTAWAPTSSVTRGKSPNVSASVISLQNQPSSFPIAELWELNGPSLWSPSCGPWLRVSAQPGLADVNVHPVHPPHFVKTLGPEKQGLGHVVSEKPRHSRRSELQGPTLSPSLAVPAISDR